VHGHFDDIAALLTDPLDRDSRPALSGGKLSRPLLGEVLSRVAVCTPPQVVRADIAGGKMLRHQLPLSEGSVSKAVSTLLDRRFLQDAELKAGERKPGPGRPGAPVALSRSRWFTIGLHIAHVRSRPSTVTAVAATLDDQVLGAPVEAQVKGETGSAWPIDAVAEAILVAIDMVVVQKAVRDREENGWLPLLGVGVGVGAHVHQGLVVADKQAYRLGAALSGLLEVPVVVENDANALAVRETYGAIAGHHDFAFVLVTDEGVGSALVLGGRVHRGSDGMAGEIGHLPVPRGREPAADVCSCRQRDHLDAYATPQRIADALGLESVGEFHSAGRTGKKAERVFEDAGLALGHGLATLVTVANPKQLIVQLPPMLHEEGASGRFGELYRKAAAAEVQRSFSTGGQTAILWRRPLVTTSGLAVMCARAAAVRVFTEFIDHLAGIDGCDAERGLSAWLASGQAAVVGGALGVFAGGYVAGPGGAALAGVAISGLVRRLSGPKTTIGKAARITPTRRQRLVIYERD
jgi:predicted NBD/HSP70 family sugar kinase